MGWFDWLFAKKKPAATVPQWARFFSADEFDAFLATVRSELERRSLAFTLRDGAVEVTLAGGETHTLGLQNLAQRCRQAPRSDWEKLVHGHFTQVLSAEAEAKDVIDKARDFEAVRGILKVNVYGHKRPGGSAAGIFTWEIADGLVGCLVYDLPNTTRSVSVGDAELWGKPRDELIRLAINNATAEPVREEDVDVQDGCSLKVLGGGFFTSSNALNLEKRVPLEHPWGALVCVPNRHTVLYHPITDIKVVAAVNTMLMLAQKMFVDGPGSITPELYWWRSGKLERLPSKIDDKALHFMPSDEFLKMLNQLAQPN